MWFLGNNGEYKKAQKYKVGNQSRSLFEGGYEVKLQIWGPIRSQPNGM